MKDPREILNSVAVESVLRPVPEELSPVDFVSKARRIMTTHNMRFLPVVEDDDLCGIIRAKDVLKISSSRSNVEVDGVMIEPLAVVYSKWTLHKTAKLMLSSDSPLVPVTSGENDPHLEDVVRMERVIESAWESIDEGSSVGSIMTCDVVTTSTEEDISKVWMKMKESNISVLPVTRKGEDIPVGMITLLDILDSGKARLALESKGQRRPAKVKTIMKGVPEVLDREDSIKEPAKILKSTEVGGLAIVGDDGGLVGIIDKEDTIKRI